MPTPAPTDENRPVPSLLDAHETTVDLAQNQSPLHAQQLNHQADVQFRHSGWTRHRSAIIRAFDRLELSDRRQERFQACGSNAWVLRDINDPSHIRLAASYCRDRFCLPCQQARAQRLLRRMKPQLANRDLRFITLTLRRSADPLRQQLDHLTASFRRLRQSKLWTRTQTGGIAFTEVKRSRDGRAWHPHLHIIAEGSYVRQQDLAKAWHKASSTSYIVDIRKVRDAAQAAHYVTSYAAKPMSYACTNDAVALDEAIAALHGKRLQFTYGAWETPDLTPDDDTTEWKPVAPLNVLLDRERRGDLAAAEILNALRRRPCTREPNVPDSLLPFR